MNKLICTLAILVVAISSVHGAKAQKKYSTVYVSVKEADSFSGLKKSQFSVTITDQEMANIFVIAMTNNTTTYYLPLKFEAMAGEGKAFHKVVTTDPFSYTWTGPSGQTEINWVYVNASIKDIYNGDTAPFDFEIQFEGGSAVKYYVSP